MAQVNFSDEEKQNLHRETGLSFETLNRVPSDKELIRLIQQRIGANFRLLAIQLGVSQVSIDQSTANHPHNVSDRIFELLQKWKRAVYSGATIAVLVAAMKEVEMNIQDLNTIFQ